MHGFYLDNFGSCITSHFVSSEAFTSGFGVRLCVFKPGKKDHFLKEVHDLYSCIQLVNDEANNIIIFWLIFYSLLLDVLEGEGVFLYSELMLIDLWQKRRRISSFVKYVIRIYPVQHWYITSAQKHESGMQIKLPRFPKFLSAPRNHYRNNKKDKRAYLNIQSLKTHPCDNSSHPGITFGYLLNPGLQNRIFSTGASDSGGVWTKGLKSV